MLQRSMRWMVLLTFAMALRSNFAQDAPSTEQLRAFQSLSPEQQQVLLQQVAGQGEARQNQSDANIAGRNEGDVNSGRRSVRDRADRTVEHDALKANDTVIVEIALPGTMQKASPQLHGAQEQSTETGARRLRPEPKVALSTEDQKKLSEMIEMVQSRNPYKLDREGQLSLPGFAPIPLRGLSEQQAVQRLSVHPDLLELDVSLQYLPLEKGGIERLKPYGYDLFDDMTSIQSTVIDTPVPEEYIVGPGDELRVQLFGSQNTSLRLVVSREGAVSFPGLGPIRVAGQRFTAAKSNIEARVAQQMIGVRANVSMGATRAIRVYVFGEVKQPGSYTISGLATMTAALFASGGVKPIGSLRNIQLKRQNVVVKNFDLYDMLMRGDTGGDATLQSGDVIFVPPVGDTVSIDGEVKRPAIYELRGDASAESLLRMAGGFTPEADPTRGSLTRVDDKFRRVVMDVSFEQVQARSQALRNGDVLQIARLRPQLDSGVVLSGFLYRPGVVAWRDGMRLSDVISSIDELKPNADSHYILVRRESGADRKVEAISADLVAALARKGSSADIQLMPRDIITVFDLAPGREGIIKPLLDELRLQSALARPTEVVRVDGRVKVPGEYPLEAGMKVSDLLRAGGNLEAAAFGTKAELARYEVTSDGTRQTELVEVDLAAVMRGDPSADILLRSYDYLLIKEIPNWTDQGSVKLSGEVRFPGIYPIRTDETLYQVIERAGGLTPHAFAKGSAFTRAGLRELEQKQRDLLADRMQSDLAALSVQAAASNQGGASQALASGQNWLAQLRQSRPVGRMVIDLPALLADGKGSPKDVLLRDGDLLVVPQMKQEVTVIGEVQTTTSHLYNPALHRDDYIRLSGGTTRKADKGKVYVVRADGSVVAQRGGSLARNFDVAIQPGDTVVVPLDAERMPRLPFWQAVTQIVYNLAVSIAAINSF